MYLKLNEMTIEEETKVENIAENLYERVSAEIEKILKSQLQFLGIEFPDRILGESERFDYAGIGLKKTLYPDDDFALCSYEYRGKKILGVSIGANRMGIGFDVPDPLKMAQYEAELKTKDSSIEIGSTKPCCGNCEGWTGEWYLDKAKRKCRKPLEEGKTFVNFHGITSAHDYCTRHAFNENWKDLKTCTHPNTENILERSGGKLFTQKCLICGAKKVANEGEWLV